MVLAGDLPNDEQEIRDELASTFDMRGITWEQQYQKQGIMPTRTPAVIREGISK